MDSLSSDDDDAAAIQNLDLDYSSSPKTSPWKQEYGKKRIVIEIIEFNLIDS